MARQNQFLGTVTIDWPGLKDIGTWDNVTGGSRSTDPNPYRPGGMGAEEQLGGTPKWTSLVLQRQFRSDRDAQIYKAMTAAVGRARAHYTEVPLNADGVAFPGAPPATYNGTFVRVNRPDRNSMSDDAAIIEIEIAPDGDVA
jgi:hypothetical protein